MVSRFSSPVEHGILILITTIWMIIECSLRPSLQGLLVLDEIVDCYVWHPFKAIWGPFKALLGTASALKGLSHVTVHVLVVQI